MVPPQGLRAHPSFRVPAITSDNTDVWIPSDLRPIVCCWNLLRAPYLSPQSSSWLGFFLVLSVKFNSGSMCEYRSVLRAVLTSVTIFTGICFFCG